MKRNKMYDFVKSSIIENAKDPHSLEIILVSNMTPKQERFCMEYLIDLNATQAAIRTGYSRHSARWIGYELRCKPYMRLYIRELMDRLIERVNGWPSGYCYRGNLRKEISDNLKKLSFDID